MVYDVFTQGIIASLNEECLVPKGNDPNLLSKVRFYCYGVSRITFSFSRVDEDCLFKFGGLFGCANHAQPVRHFALCRYRCWITKIEL
jgi:hypothetical protein